MMYNGAWDYPATHGNTRSGQCRNCVASNHADVIEVQQSFRRGGVVRAMAFVNHGNMGTYRAADRDIISTRKPGTIKYGFGVNVEQKIVCGRLGWNDGKTESWAFTEIDRTGSGGMVIRGSRWRRRNDVIGAGIAVNGLSGDHQASLARGGYGFLIGDGSLR